MTDIDTAIKELDQDVTDNHLGIQGDCRSNVLFVCQKR